MQQDAKDLEPQVNSLITFGSNELFYWNIFARRAKTVNFHSQTFGVLNCCFWRFLWKCVKNPTLQKVAFFWPWKIYTNNSRTFELIFHLMFINTNDFLVSFVKMFNLLLRLRTKLFHNLRWDVASGIVFGQASANKTLKRPKTAAASDM
jgi:hypothetical protein